MRGRRPVLPGRAWGPGRSYLVVRRGPGRSNLLVRGPGWSYLVVRGGPGRSNRVMPSPGRPTRSCLAPARPNPRAGFRPEADGTRLPSGQPTADRLRHAAAREVRPLVRSRDPS
ncbi:hypothetical protein GCM10010166_29740 [Couchioplanes caeruleus subsp. azureus]|nr:hypothetical protein GCM10010166_29740 [Couchioplanes caeruleus subsp. azureus]